MRQLLQTTAAVIALSSPVAAIAGGTGFGGPYVGVNIAYDKYKLKETAVFNDGISPVSYSVSDSKGGFYAEAIGGYNYSIGSHVVIGAELDFGNAFGKQVGYQFRDTGSGYSIVAFAQPKWNAGINFRLGFIVSDNFLVYDLIGYEFAHFNGGATEALGNFTTTRVSGSKNLNGLKLGVGLEARVNNHLSARLEFTHVNYGSKVLDSCSPVPSTTCGYFSSDSVNGSRNRFTYGMAYHF